MPKKTRGRPKKASYKSNDRYSGMKKNPFVEGHKTRKKKKRERINGGHYNHTYTKKKLPKPRYKSTIEYDFLQYIRVVFKWAMEKYEVRRPELEMLLYLYPKGVFTKTEMLNFQRTISIYQDMAFRSMVQRGFIRMWRPARGRESALYTLSDQWKRICNKMHRMLTGEEDISINPQNNPMAKPGGKRINKYYMEVVKEMNKHRNESD